MLDLVDLFGFERLWYRLLRWMTNKRSSEPTIINAFKAFLVASTAMVGTPLDNDDPADGSDPSSQFIDHSVATPWYHVPHTFIETFELQLPSFTRVHSH